MKAKILTLASLALLGASALAPGCKRKSTSQDADVARRQEELVALEAKRRARAGELKGMETQRLVELLAADTARGVEPFNSMAFREVVSRGAAAAAPLRAALSKPAASSLLGLLALRRISPGEYRSLDPGARSQVLVAALRESKFFNTWGLPHVAWEEAGKAMIEEGAGVEAGLVGLLGDRRQARVWGSEGASEAARYGYRICDYAWALLNEIRRTPVPIPEDPSARDKLIEAAKR